MLRFVADRTYRRESNWPRASWPKKPKKGERRYTCGMCRCSFVPKRSDAEYCSGACRVMAYRRRKEWADDNEAKLAAMFGRGESH